MKEYVWLFPIIFIFHDMEEIPYYEKDNIVWMRTPEGDKKRTPEERDKVFEEIVASHEWIVEGSPRNCLKESFEHCEYIIVLDERTFTRLIRVFKRWMLQKLGKEKYNSEPTLKFLYYDVGVKRYFAPN